MTRHRIVIRRTALGQQIAAHNTTIGTDAYNAWSSVPGVTDVCIEADDGAQVEISYSYTLKDKFMDTVTYLAKFGLERVDWKK
jgi:hypothetical protein